MSFEWRPHRGGLAEAMAEKRTFESFDDLLMHLRDDWSEWHATIHNVTAEPYAYDERINWDTYIVSGEIRYTMKDKQRVEKTVFGFTNGNPFPPSTVHSFRDELQDLITRWLAKGVHPTDLRTIALDYCGDLAKMEELAAEMATLPSKEPTK